MGTKNADEFKMVSIDDALKLLETSVDGLAESEAGIRVEKFGYNEIVKKRRNPLLEFFSRYWGPMPWLLEFAIALSFFLGHYIEAMIIFALLTVNVIIGFSHERSSQRALEFLKRRLAIKVKVLRDGRWSIKDAKELVLGDIFVVGLGDVVPADAKIVDGKLSVDQSSLTGESMPVEVRRSDIIYSGSVVSRGEAKCVVVNTGTNTYFGKTAELVKLAKPTSHQEELMMAIVRYMMCLGLVALGLVSIFALLAGLGFLSILTIAVIFLMGSVPVALPAVFTIVQAVGAMELVEKNVLVTRLDSIEDAASMDVLCLDKTGTITQNKLSVIGGMSFSGYGKEDLAVMACLASREEGKDLIDLAVIEYVKTIGADLGQYKQVSFTPFDPLTKRSEAIIEKNGNRFRVSKGSPQIIISMCKGIDERTRMEADKAIEEMSQKGYRTLAVARSRDKDLSDLLLVGMLSLADPLRLDSRATIEEAKGLGLKPIMLTGDNINIAKEIAHQASIGNRIIRMADLEGLGEGEKAKIIEETDGFAEIYPEDKYRIVKSLQSRGHVVGMTGDGVNDAPALKQAEIGIAVSDSSDVAKASAGVVLTGQGVGVIIDAVKTSRQIYQRMLTWVINKVSKTVQVIGLLTLTFLWFHNLTITLFGMALLVVANDFVTMSIATDKVRYTINPDTWNMKNIVVASLIVGMLLVIGGMITVLIGANYFKLGLAELQTFVMLMLVFTSLFRVFIVRERRHFWDSRPSKEVLISTSAAVVGFTLLGVYGLIVPSLALYHVLFVLGFSALFTLGIDPIKYYVFRKFAL